MPVTIEEILGDIGLATHFCDVRDLLEAWTAAKGDGVPTLDALAPLLSRESVSDHLVVLSLQDDKLIHDFVGPKVVSLFGNNLVGLPHNDIKSPSAEGFRRIYYRVINGTEPAFAVQNLVGYGASGATERLVLPVEQDGMRKIICYIRVRQDAVEIVRSLFDISADAILVLAAVRDEAGAIVDFVISSVNAEAGRRFEMHPSEVMGMPLSAVIPGALEFDCFDRLAQSVANQKPDVFDIHAEFGGALLERQVRLAPHGNSITVTSVDLTPVLSATRAIERQRNELVEANALLEKRARDLHRSNAELERAAKTLREEIERNRELEAKLIQLAHHDVLTGLINRGHFEERFEAALTQATIKRRRTALCAIDLDHFKDINDSLGHNVGDAVLQEVARRLESVTRKTDIIARLGGDEFGLLISDALEIEHVGMAVERMMAVVAQPIEINRQMVPIELSVGIAIYPDDGKSASELMLNADTALYRAKRSGRSRSVFFAPAMRDETERRIRLLSRLGSAVAANEIVPFYQPFVDLQTGRIIGFEALARWIHPERGLLGPAIFSDAWDEPEIAQSITRAIVEQTAADIASWDPAIVPIRVNLNVTGFDLRQSSFATTVRDVMWARGVASSKIVIEVTESTIFSRDSERIKATLEELRGFGFRLALDDFGTGYASLSHLRSLPVDILKIDRSFISNLGDPKTAAIVRSVIDLAEPLDLEIVAEGVETQAQFELVRALGADFGQGYLIASAMPADEVEDFVLSFGRPPSSRRGSAA